MFFSEKIRLALASSGKLSENDFELIIDLFEHNMKHLYQRSNWGFDKTAKRVELENPLARLVFFKLVLVLLVLFQC